MSMLKRELEKLFKEIDEQYPKSRKRPNEEEILEEIQTYRREKKLP